MEYIMFSEHPIFYYGPYKHFCKNRLIKMYANNLVLMISTKSLFLRSNKDITKAPNIQKCGMITSQITTNSLLETTSAGWHKIEKGYCCGIITRQTLILTIQYVPACWFDIILTIQYVPARRFDIILTNQSIPATINLIFNYLYWGGDIYIYIYI